MILNAEKLRQFMHYDPLTGIISRLITTSSNAKAGDIANSKRRGYIRVRLLGNEYFAHRLAWLYVYGKWPEHDIDHINGIKDDNRIANLRDVGRSINMQNQRVPRITNKLGLIGVRKHAFGKYQATITLNYVQKSIGYFDTPELAHQAYVEAKRKYHLGCTI